MTDNRTTEKRISEPLRGFIRHQSNRAYIDGGQARWLTEIADEIDARHERTCECVSEYAESPFDGKTIVLHRCSECHELMRPHMLYCPNCGRKVSA